MRILMLSRDGSGVKKDSKTASRWRLLRDAGAELDILVACPSMESWEEAGIRVCGSGGSNPFARLASLSRLARPLASRADLITAQDPFELGLLASRLARRFKKSFEVQDHGGFFDGKPADEPLWAIRSRLASWIVSRATAVRTVSPGSLQRLEGKAKAYFLPIAADLRFAELEREPDPNLVVCTARLISVKRHDLLLRAFAEVRKLRPSAKLVLVGDGPLRAPLESLAESLGLSSSVEFVGEADPSPYLSRASCFVLLSSHEGWGVASVEAALAGVPVVMSDTGCAAWLSERGRASVAYSDDPSQIAQEVVAAMGRTSLPGLIKGVMSQKESAERQVAQWRRVLSVRPRILVFVQAADERDALMGYFVNWLREASKDADLLVAALRVGNPAPEIPGVRIFPLRGRGSFSRFEVLRRGLSLSWSLRREYDGVFVRGDAQYVALFGWLWRLLGKRVVLWYAHYTSTTPWLRPASWFAHDVVTSVRAACSLSRARPIGQGVDASRFSEVREQGDPARLLIFGRVSPVKRVPWMVERLIETGRGAISALSIHGKATEAAEGERLREMADKNGIVWKEEDVLPSDSPRLYEAYDVYVNATPGSLDKTIVEAMLCGLVVVALTPGYGECLPEDLKWLCPSESGFAKAAAHAAALSPSERSEIGRRLRAIALERHSQTGQIGRILQSFR